MSEIGNNIKARLKELRETQGWLAEKVDVSNMAVSNWIKTGSMTLDNAVAVADVLGITLDQLVKGLQASESTIEPHNDLVRATPVERRVLSLFRGADDRGKLEMLGSIEEYARGVEDERRRSEAKARRTQGAQENRDHQPGVVDLDQARLKS